ncbi:Rieske (2Fe-2S) protein [Lignipirellula cremea]|uniref:Naphthalene 1,2-dioxygenase system ferredoxin subunit n=1 Tax=Lignipirellula cremea TaxID=2528010 RepID=A0A518DNJ2_9BACT|nr:non-heme iron oxygenase ferredoxin subunit [Lignipirellula cremea]QDU93399.1 Naphthalene 1,2-dioxygenase system ferredoxin subunit [Lignipirellula cremea]
MTDWIRIAAVSDCPPGEAREFVAAGRMVALYHVDDEFYAIDGVCPHQGGPLGKGTLAGCTVTCPWHGWQYDVRTGKHCSLESLVQPTFAVKVENDEIFVDVTQERRSDVV